MFSFGTPDIFIEAAFTGTVGAPNALIRLQNVFTHHATFLARAVIVQGNVIVEHLPFQFWEA